VKAAFAALLAAECVVGPGLGRPLTPADLGRFAAEAQPALASCANPSCHGRPERPLALYAPGLHRADPSRRWLDEPLTEAELAANLERVLPFVDPGDPVRSTLVQKPLDPARGGVPHRGGVQWEDPADPGCADVIAWIAALSEGA
jgi:hypothetical protein